MGRFIEASVSIGGIDSEKIGKEAVYAPVTAWGVPIGFVKDISKNEMKILLWTENWIGFKNENEKLTRLEISGGKGFPQKYSFEKEN